MANIPIFIPHSGCKNDCAFCDQKSITGNVRQPSFEETKKIIEDNLKTLSGNDNKIAFFGGSFTGIGNDLMEGYLKVAAEYVKNGFVSGIRLSTRPDYIDGEVLKILKKYSVTNIELGAQSLDDEVLKAVGRGHTAQDVEKAMGMIVEEGFTPGLQMMIGLPGDTYEKSVETARKFVLLGSKEARIYPTVVIKGTRLAKMYEAGEYVPMSFDEAVDTAADCYGIFFENGVKVLRIGLQNSQTLKESVVGGFYHDAMGETVYSRVVRRSAERCANAEIVFGKRFLSKVLGQKRTNIDYFEKNGIKYTLTQSDEVDGVCVNGKYVLTI